MAVRNYQTQARLLNWIVISWIMNLKIDYLAVNKYRRA